MARGDQCALPVNLFPSHGESEEGKGRENVRYPLPRGGRERAGGDAAGPGSEAEEGGAGQEQRDDKGWCGPRGARHPHGGQKIPHEVMGNLGLERVGVSQTLWVGTALQEGGTLEKASPWELAAPLGQAAQGGAGRIGGPVGHAEC